MDIAFILLHRLLTFPSTTAHGRAAAGPRPIVNIAYRTAHEEFEVETAIVHRPIAAAYRDTTSHNVWLCLLYRKMSMPV
jgi:hypothetical protein